MTTTVFPEALALSKISSEKLVFFSTAFAVKQTNKNIAQKLGIKFWTTIVVYKGNDEVVRIVGQTDKEIIYAAIQKGI